MMKSTRLSYAFSILLIAGMLLNLASPVFAQSAPEAVSAPAPVLAAEPALAEAPAADPTAAEPVPAALQPYTPPQAESAGAETCSTGSSRLPQTLRVPAVYGPAQGEAAEVFTGAAPPSANGGGLASLSGSKVTFEPGVGGAASCFTPGIQQTLCFKAESFTNDWEYVYNVLEKFPSNWTVSDVYVQGTPTCSSGSGWGDFSWSFQTAPYEVNISHARYMAPVDQCSATYCFVVTPGFAPLEVPVSWYWTGDGYGGPPHHPCSSDQYTPGGWAACDEWVNPPASVPPCSVEPGIYLFPETVAVSGCNGTPQQHEFTLANYSGSNALVDLSYALLDPMLGAFTGPPSVYVEDGSVGSFTTQLTPEVCLPNQVVVEGSLTATYGNFSDSAQIQKTIQTGTFWETIPAEPSSGRMDNVVASHAGKIWSITGYGSDANVRYYSPGTNSWTVVPGSSFPFGTNYARSGCQVGSEVFIYGDAAVFNGLWSYNMDTNTWTEKYPSGTPPPYSAIWAPAWAYDPVGGNCYLTGGATSPGPGNLSSVYVYNPSSNTWLAPLPDFSGWRDFHAAWVLGSGADRKLCVAGGNDGGDLSSTQCYHFSSGAWGSLNADIPALPSTWWAAGFTQKTAPSGQELWLVGGVKGGNLSNEAYYFTPGSGWQSAGTFPSGAAYRNAAAVLEGKVYKLGGSTGGFNFTGNADRLFSCPECTDLGTLQGYVYDYDAANPPGRPAVVQTVPGGVTIPVGPDGFYQAALVPFSYQVTASASGYPEVDGPYPLTIANGQTTVQNFVLHRPDIDYSPGSFSVELEYGQTTTTLLNLHNLGSRPLAYEIKETPASAAGAQTRSYQQVPQVVGVDPQIYTDMAASPQGTAGFFIAFKETADLSAAYTLGWNERGRFVVDALQRTAAAAQRNVAAWLDGQGVEYTSYWINNTLFVTGDLALLESAAAFPEVSGFMANHKYQTMPVSTNASMVVTSQGSYPWNVIFPEADRVHSEAGLRGEGIVIGGMDTGVEYLHQGLVNTYRGSLGGGSFDHTYSWFNPGGDECGSGAPCDTDGHGTATHGIMGGDDDPSLPSNAWTGMAPNSKWIHCLGLPYGSGYDSELNACAQWFLAPGGDPDMRPQVVNHSWGSWSPNSCGGNWYAPALQAYRAADIVPAFAAGNVGDYVSPPHCSSSTPPANNTDGDGNPLAFASGAHGSNGLLDYYSSGGPNACNPDRLFPDVASPGLGSCTTGMGNSYNCSFGGTSSASPHTAGCVALVRQAAPWLSVDEVEQIIRETATDVDDTGCGGDADWNNKYGEGRLNCFAAVSAVYAADLPWLSTSPITGTLPAWGGFQEVTVSFDAGAVDDPGLYQAELKITNSDPVSPNVVVPVSLNVTPPFNLGRLEGTVQSLGYCDSNPSLLKDAEVLITSASGDTWTVSTNASGYFYKWLYQEGSPYTLSVSHPAHVGDSAAGVIVTGQGTTVQDFALRWLYPCASAAPDSLYMSLNLGQTATLPLTIFNDGAANLEWLMKERAGETPRMQVFTARPVITAQPGERITLGGSSFSASPAAPAAPAPAQGLTLEGTTLTHSLSQVIQQFNSVSCNAGGLHTDNSYLRVFDLAAFGISSAFEVIEVEFGVEQAQGSSGTQPVEVRLYTLSGPLVWANMTLIGSASVPLPNMSLDKYTIPVSAFVEPDSILVVEVFTPSGQAVGNSFFVGSNNMGQTAPTYLAAAECGVTEPLDTAVIGFPGMHLVLNVTGELTSADVGWLSAVPESGTVLADSQQAIDIHFDAGADEIDQPGDYHATLKLQSGDSNRGTIDIPVVLHINPPTDWGHLTGTVLSLGYCGENPAPLANAMVHIENAGGMVWTTKTNAMGVYNRYLPAAGGPYTVHVTAAEHLDGHAEDVVITAQQTTTQDFDLRWLKPCVFPTPEAFSVDVAIGYTAVFPLTLTNTGPVQSTYKLREAAPSLLGEAIVPAAGVDTHTAPKGYTPTKAQTVLSGRTAGTVAIFKDADAWGSFAIENILYANGIPYEVHGSGAFASLDFSAYGMIVISGDQPTFFYDAYAAYASKFEEYVEGGGFLNFFSCDSGWNGGVLSAPLPGGMVWNGWFYENYNTITDPEHAVTQGVPSPFYGTSASHGHFSSLPAEAHVIAVETDNLQPTIVEYGLGSGWMIAFGQPLEISYDWGWHAGQILVNTLLWGYTYEGAFDLPWLEVDPLEGLISGDSSQEISLTFTAFPTMTVGETHSGSLVLKSEDPLNPKVTIPVEMNVVNVSYGVSVPPDMQGYYMPGMTYTYEVEVTNTGTVPDTFALSLAGHAWPSTLSATSLSLLPGQSASVLAMVSIPAGATEGQWDATVFKAQSTSSAMWDDCQLKTTAVIAPQASFTFSPAVPRAGAAVVFTNTSLGTEPLTYLWEFGDGATSTLKNPTHTFTAAGNYTVRLSATNQGDWDTFEQVIVVHELPAADDLELVLSISPTPVFLFQEETITAQVTNTGAASIAGVTASGAVPAHVTVVSYSDECSLSGGVLTCDLGTIAAGQSKTAWVKVIFTATGSFTHSMLLSPVDEVATLDINVQAALYLPIVRR